MANAATGDANAATGAILFKNIITFPQTKLKSRKNWEKLVHHIEWQRVSTRKYSEIGHWLHFKSQDDSKSGFSLAGNIFLM